MKKRTFRICFPWDYQKELKTVNERSKAGFHLIRSSFFWKLEEQDGSVQYRYLVDCAEAGSFTELLYEKQGWELCCRQGKLLFFRKRCEEDRQETEYEIHGDERHAIADCFHRRIKPLDLLRNLLLILAVVLVLIPGDITNSLTPRIACIPLFLCLIPVRIAENYRKALGEQNRK
ncbi:MAG: DUF2812 domain-containing protein [Oscillospiraceae bacterium]|nr:DUF2812 domain-containing protein [Oscillospiraceae bacterium]